MLPVIVLKCLVPQQQIPEAIARRKRRHLRVHLCHLESRDVQNNARVAAVVPLQGLGGGPAGREAQQHQLIDMPALESLVHCSDISADSFVLADHNKAPEILYVQ